MPAVAGIAIGGAGAGGANRVLESLLHDVKPTDAWVYALTAFGVAAIALLRVTSLPGRQDASTRWRFYGPSNNRSDHGQIDPDLLQRVPRLAKIRAVCRHPVEAAHRLKQFRGASRNGYIDL